MTAFLRSALLTLALFGACTSAAAQSASRAGLAGAEVQPGQRSDARAAGGVEAAPVPGPRRAPSIHRASRPLEERALAGTCLSARATTTGAVIGGVLGGAAGFAFGHMLDNIERTGGARFGSQTILGTAGGAVAGALAGAGVGWLVAR